MTHDGLHHNLAGAACAAESWFTFTACSNAQLSYSLTDDNLAGDMAISRLIMGGKALCEELAGAE